MASPGSIPGSMPAAPVQVSSAAQISPVEAARLAAERRAAAPPPLQHSSSADSHSRTFDPASFSPSPAEKLKFHRTLDSVLLPNCSKPQAVKTLELLTTVTDNVLNPSNPATAHKYRQLRLNNTQVARNLVDVKGAFEYMILAGWHRTVVEYVPYLNFSQGSPSPKQLYQLRVANLVLKTVLARAREAEERESRYRQSEKEAEKERKGKAMLGFEEDRRLRKEKDEREKLVRDSRAAAAAAAAAAPPPADPHSVDADHPLFNIQSNAADTMDVDPAHGDLPPSYGASLIASGSGGRVLGTGAVVGGPPPGVRMVHQQDLDEDEDEDEEDY